MLGLLVLFPLLEVEGSSPVRPIVTPRTGTTSSTKTPETKFTLRVVS